MTQNNIKRAIFTEYEEFLLLGLVSQNKSIIENKESDAKTILRKHEVWENVVAKEFNNDPRTREKTTQQLQKKYKNMKMKSLKDLAAERRERKQTGGGPESIVSDPKTELIASIIPNQARPLDNQYDDDAEFLREDSTILDQKIDINSSIASYGSDKQLMELELESNTLLSIESKSENRCSTSSDSNKRSRFDFNTSSGSNSSKKRGKTSQDKIIDFAQAEHELKMKILQRKLEYEDEKISNLRMENQLNTLLLQKKLEKEGVTVHVQEQVD